MEPHLVRRRDGAIDLVEQHRRRTLSSGRVADALERLLGTPRVDGPAPDDRPDDRPASDVALVAPSSLAALAERTPPHAEIILADPQGSEAPGGGRRFHPLHLHPPVDGSPGKPPDGQGLLDQLAVAHARGATHLIASAAAGRWLRRFPDLAEHLARRAHVVACNRAGALWELSPSVGTGPPKLLCIGLAKTGTTSLHAALGQLGLRSLHSGDEDAHPNLVLACLAAARGIREAQRDGERLLHHLGEQFDAYSDINALSARFELADLQYPGSRFILTVRDADEWVDSHRRHVDRNRALRDAGRYQGSNLELDERRLRAEGHAHVERVLGYFSGRDDLLVLDVCGGEGWARLAPFLDRPVPDVPFPTENVGDQPFGAATLARVIGSRVPPRLATYLRARRRQP